MPIYAYRCSSCGHAKDVLQKMSDPVLSVCPACGASRFEKQVTAAGFQLKGSGWYVTDFRGGNNATAAKKDDADAAPAKEDKGDKGEKGDKLAKDAVPAAAKPAAPAAGGAAPTTSPTTAPSPAAAPAAPKPTTGS
jgi:putative FmdB family regulatory protein